MASLIARRRCDTSEWGDQREDEAVPELPEVETCRRALEPLLVGRQIGSYRSSGLTLRAQASVGDMAELGGRTIEQVARRSKYLIITASGQAVLVHLGMTGQLFVSQGEPPWARHEHWRLELSDGWLRYRDPRRFGMLLRCSEAALATHPRLVGLGPEPLTERWTDEAFIAACKRSSRAIKPVIMDAKTVVGVGNIYAAEALFAAGIDPRRSADRVAPARLRRLRREIIAVLERALDSGGSTVRTFLSSDGAPGYFAQQLAVYGRQGEPCRTCERPLRLIRLGGRSTVFCGSCQR